MDIRTAQQTFQAEPGGPISDRELLRHWYWAFDQEADPRGGDIDDAAEAALKTHGCWLWVDTSGAVVSEWGPVYTPRHWHGKGYGSAVTAAAICDVLTDGDLPVLFTDLANSVEDRLEIAFRSV